MGWFFCVVMTPGCSLPTYAPTLVQTASLTGSPTGWETWRSSPNAPRGWSPAPHSAGPLKGTDSHSVFQPAPFLPGSMWPSTSPCQLERPTFSRVCFHQPPTETVFNLTHSLTLPRMPRASGSLRSTYAAQTFPWINPIERKVPKGSVPFSMAPRRGYSQMLLSVPPPLYYSTTPGLCIYP